MDALMKRLDLMEEHVNVRLDKIDQRIGAQEKKLEAYENKGRGVLIGVGLFGATMGVSVFAIAEKIVEWLK